MNGRQGKLRAPRVTKSLQASKSLHQDSKIQKKALICALKFLFEPKVIFRSSRNQGDQNNDMSSVIATLLMNCRGP